MFDDDPLGIAQPLAGTLHGGETFVLLRADESAFCAECDPRGIAALDVTETATGERCAVLGRFASPSASVAAASHPQWSTVSAWAVTSSAAHGTQTAEQGSLQLAFGRHLLRTREIAAIIVQPPVIVLDDEPEPGETGLLPFPHMVVVIFGAGQMTDRIMWEAMAPAVLTQMIGRASFDLEYWRRRLGSLVALKATLRVGNARAASSRAMRSLDRALKDRYLSFRFVLQHEDLLREVIEDTTPRSVP